MRRILAFLLAAALVPGMALALGLGDLQQRSGLNEPFRARIELLGADAAAVEDLKVGLASQEVFDRAGVPRPFLLSKLRFDVVRTDRGAYIDVSTEDPVREPFLNFLLELAWPQGRLVREYTALLDPPTYDARRRAAGAPATPAAATRAVAGAAAPASALGGTLGRPTGATDTQWSIASRIRPDESVTVQQVMLALLRANPEAFAEDNVNTLKRGYVLRLPEREEIEAVSPEEAFAQVRRHNALWEELRQRLAAAPPPRPLGVAPSAPAPAVAAKTEEGDARLQIVAPEEGGGAGAEGPSDAELAEMDLAALRNELALANERLAAQEQENADLRSRLTEAEELVEKLQRLITLREEELAALQQQLAEAGASVPEAPAEEGLPAAPAAGEPAVAPAAVEEPPPPEAPPAVSEPEIALEVERPGATAEEIEAPPPSGALAAAEALVARVVPAWILQLLPGGALTVLALLGLVVFVPIGYVAAQRVRRAGETMMPAAAPVSRAAAPAPAVDSEDTTIAAAMGEEEGAEQTEPPTEVRGERVPAEEIPASERTARMTAAGTPAGAAAATEPAEDPLAEVNVYLAYERFEQAEQLVKEAIAKEPDNDNYKLRLLEVYYSANNKPAFEDAARALHERTGGSGPLWDSAVAMWKEMSPDRDLFEEGAAAAAAPAVEGPRREFLDITGTVAEAEAEPGEATVTTRPGAPDEADEGLEFRPGDTVEQPAAAAEEGVLDLTAGGEDVFDLTAGGIETSGEPEEELLDLTSGGGEAATEEELLDITGGGERPDADQELALDLTAGGEAPAADRDAGMLEFTGGAAQAPDERFDLDLTAGGEEAPAEEVSFDLDLTAGGERAPEEAGEDLLDVTGGSERPAAVAEGLELDLTAGDSGEELLDLTGGGPAAGEEEELLDLTGGGPAAEEQEALLDVTGGGAGEDLLDVTVTGDLSGMESEDLLNVTAPGALGARPERTVEDTGEQAEPPAAAAGDNVIEFDITGAGGAEPSEARTLESAGLPDDEQALDFDISDLTLGGEGEAGEAGEAQEPPMDAAVDDALEIDLADAGGDAGTGVAGNEGLDVEAFELDSSESGESIEDLTRSLEDTVAGLSVSLEGEQEQPDDVGEPVHLETVKLEPEAGGEEEDDAERTVVMPRAEVEEQSEEDEVDTKLNLAKAYIELGDADGARAILDEVISEGNLEQRQEAQRLREQL